MDTSGRELPQLSSREHQRRASTRHGWARLSCASPVAPMAVDVSSSEPAAQARHDVPLFIRASSRYSRQVAPFAHPACGAWMGTMRVGGNGRG